MDKLVARTLKARATEVARNFSSPTRALNHTGEIFTVDEIIPLSAQSAIVIFKKNSGKKAIAHFIHIRQKSRWIYYFISAAHLLNLDRLSAIYHDVEIFNYPLNFNKDEI